MREFDLLAVLGPCVERDLCPAFDLALDAIVRPGHPNKVYKDQIGVGGVECVKCSINLEVSINAVINNASKICRNC